jgi:hypothetical protein
MNKKEEREQQQTQIKMDKGQLKKEIEVRDKETMRLRQKLWKIEDEEYLKKVKKVLGNYYLRTYGRGKNKDYSFVKLTVINKKRIEATEIYVSRKEKYSLSELTSGRKITEKQLLSEIKEILKDG